MHPFTRRLAAVGSFAAVAGIAAGLAPAFVRRVRAQGTTPVPNQPLTLASAIAADPRLTNFAAMLGRTSVHQRLSMPGQRHPHAPATLCEAQRITSDSADTIPFRLGSHGDGTDPKDRLRRPEVASPTGFEPVLQP